MKNKFKILQNIKFGTSRPNQSKIRIWLEKKQLSGCPNSERLTVQTNQHNKSIVEEILNMFKL